MQSFNKQVQWDDIIGHIRPKELLKEAIVYPIKVSISIYFTYFLNCYENIKLIFSFIVQRDFLYITMEKYALIRSVR